MAESVFGKQELQYMSFGTCCFVAGKSKPRTPSPSASDHVCTNEWLHDDVLSYTAPVQVSKSHYSLGDAN